MTATNDDIVAALVALKASTDSTNEILKLLANAQGRNLTIHENKIV
jgi:hypothetical protein